MHFIECICLLFSLFPLAWSKATENEGIVELLQELRKEPPPEPVWMLHEAGSILDDTWNPTVQESGAAEASPQKDLVQPHEKHLEGVPVFIQQPESIYYAWRGKPAVFECIAEPVSHAVAFCADKTFPYMGNEHTSEQRLQVTRLDSNGNLDADGPRWHLRLPIRTKDLEEWFDAYICTCEVWNLIPALKQVKKVFSRNATIIEAYLDREFQLEPIPEQLVKGQRLLLSCQPPKGEPAPKVYWLKNGKRVEAQTFPHIIIDDYNRLIIEQVELQDEGNYTCVADTLGMEQRYSTAEVTVLPYRREPQTHLRMTPWTTWSACKLEPLSGRCQQTRTRTCFNVSTLEETVLPPSASAFPDPPPTCPQSVFESRICESTECGGEISETTGEKKNASSSVNVREIMFYVGLVAAFTVTALIIFTVCRLNRRKPSHFSNSLCPGRFSSRQNEYGKSMTILKNSQSSTYDMPPITNGVGSLPRQLKVSSPATESTAIGLLDYSSKNASPRGLVQSQTRRPVSGAEAGNTYNQPYSPIPAMFTPMSPGFPNGRPFQSPKFNYLLKESPSLASNGNTAAYSPLPGGGGYTNPPPPGQPIPPLPPPYMAPSRSSASSSTGGLQAQQQPIYLSPSSTPNTGLGGAEGGDDCSSAFYHEIGTAAESIFPLIPPLPVAAGETGSTTWANIGSVGGVVNLPESGISLRIPPGSVPSGVSREVYLATCRDEKYWPALSEHQTLLSSVIQIGLPGAPLSKPVIVTFPHCANMTGQSAWSFSIHCYCSTSGFDSIYKGSESTTVEWSWREVAQIGQEQARDPIHCYLSGNQAHLMTQYPLRFCLVGQATTFAPTSPNTLLVGATRMGISTDCSENHSGSSMATETTNDTLPSAIPPPLSKRLRLIAFASRFTNVTDCSLRIYAVLDTVDAVRHVKDTEAKLDGQLIGGGKQMLFKNSGGGLVFRIQELSPHWRTRLSCQEIPFRHIWSGNRNTLLHCSFTLERVDDATPGLHCTIACQQDGVPGTQQVLHLNVNSGSPEGKHLQPSQTGNSSYSEQNEFRLPSYVVFQLCSMLDPIAPLGNDWRQLAQHLNMERFLPYFASTQRPTEMVLNLWEALTTAKGPLAHQELISILQSMHRLDCANLVRSQFSLVSSRKDHV
uniref:Netrin receptor UNC5 n=1 Tax=Echinococcus granulosus TaxID=6210 RepID=A0A068WQ91_ECHGR|nr:netrin receptor unc 5 [Echinococcus granulosus]